MLSDLDQSVIDSVRALGQWVISQTIKSLVKPHELVYLKRILYIYIYNVHIHYT